jgi:hypothetical protein
MTCPICKCKFEAESNGKMIECPKCKKVLRVKAVKDKNGNEETKKREVEDLNNVVKLNENKVERKQETEVTYEAVLIVMIINSIPIIGVLFSILGTAGIIYKYNKTMRVIFRATLTWYLITAIMLFILMVNI